MIETTLLIGMGLGAGIAYGGIIVGSKFLTGEPYISAHKRTEKDVKKTEQKLDKHFSVINIEEDEAFDKMMEEHEPIIEQPIEDTTEVTEFSASVSESPVQLEPPKKNFFICDEPGCSFRGKSAPAEDGKHYCKNHGASEDGK